MAVIADLDLLTDTTKIQRILEILCDDETVLLGLLKRVDEIAKAIRLLPPTISEQEAVDELKKFADQKYDWKDGDDKTLRSELNSLSRSLNGMRGVKDGGLRQLPEHIRDPLERLLGDLECHGGLA